MSPAAKRSDRWDADRIPRLDGRVALVTGASSGTGFETARYLPRRGATVVLACRNDGKAQGAVARIRADFPAADLRAVHLDLASLASVRKAACEAQETSPRLDLLINNAGVMWAPEQRTEDGFELHFATNHLGHFTLTGLLLDALRHTPGSRIVTVSSPAHRKAELDLDDLQSEKRYRPIQAYGRSKLANLLFTYELQRRLARTGTDLVALAAHPGGTRSELNRNMPILFRGRSWGLARPITHDAHIGALSIVRAAVDPQAKSGEYYGPAGPGQFRGYPTLLTSSDRSQDPEVAEQLWELSEELTGVTYEI